MSWNHRSGARPSEKVDDIPLVSFADDAGLAMEAEAAVGSRMLSIGFAPSDQRNVPCCVAVALTTAMQFVGATAPLARCSTTSSRGRTQRRWTTWRLPTPCGRR